MIYNNLIFGASKLLSTLLTSIRNCQICKDLPLGPRPIVQADSLSKILIVGQAPGQVTHRKGIPFDDPSGERLRDWLGVDRKAFYDPKNFAILPMGFCYPGKGKSGDLPPRPECAPKWRTDIMAKLTNIELTIIVGQYALEWHLGAARSKTLTQTVTNWRQHWPSHLPLPHPSPRNIRWFKQNQWFEEEILPVLKSRVQKILS